MTELVETEPSSFEEAIEKPLWVEAMVEEYKSIVNKSFWEVVPKPANKSVVGSRWDRSIEKYKARFVAKRNS